jgi:aminoglycoside phosphotransferase (APT) family kinase protein
MQTCLARSGQLLDMPALRRTWEILRELPRGAGGDVMSHGDLIPGNVLVSRGRLAGVLDVGGPGPADPALDLVAAWHLLEPGRGRYSAATWDVMTPTGNAARHGPSSRP